MEFPVNYSLHIYYVYTHCDPRTGEIVYVGKGCRGRAWFLPTGRSPEHVAWWEEMEFLGYTPMDVVDIIEKNLTDWQARRREEDIISKYKPEQLFNKKCGPGSMREEYSLSFTPTVVKAAGKRFEYTEQDVRDFCEFIERKRGMYQLRSQQIEMYANWIPVDAIAQSTDHHYQENRLGGILKKFETFLQLRNSSQ